MNEEAAVAPTLSERATIASGGALQRRLRQGLALVAAQVAAEVPPDPSRVALATQITQDPVSWVKRFAISVANNPNVGTGVQDPTEDTAEGDGALLWVIDQLWATFAPNYGPLPEPPSPPAEPETEEDRTEPDPDAGPNE